MNHIERLVVWLCRSVLWISTSVIFITVSRVPRAACITLVAMRPAKSFWKKSTLWRST